MEILFDLTATQPNKIKFHGGGEYAKTVFLNVLEQKENENITTFYNPDKELDPLILSSIKSEKIELISIKDKYELEKYIDKHKFDLFYSALPYSYHDIQINIPKVVFTIHGLRVLECHTDKFEYKYLRNFNEIVRYIGIRLFKKRHKKKYKQKIINLFRKGENRTIIVPSLHTKYSIKNFIPEINTENIEVLYSPEVDNFNSVDFSVSREKELLQKYNLRKDSFFLITSAQRWVKNSYRAIKAIDEIYTEQKIDEEFKTVILGYRKNLNFERELKNPDRFITEGYVSFEVLGYLYKNAFAFLYPTLNEGFGYPPLESMRFRTPVIGSNMSSIPEICENAILYFNPYSKIDIKNKILKVIREDGLSIDLINKGLIRYKEVKKKQDKDLLSLSKIILNRKENLLN